MKRVRGLSGKNLMKKPFSLDILETSLEDEQEGAPGKDSEAGSNVQMSPRGYSTLDSPRGRPFFCESPTGSTRFGNTTRESAPSRRRMTFNRNRLQSSSDTEESKVSTDELD